MEVTSHYPSHVLLVKSSHCFHPYSRGEEYLVCKYQEWEYLGALLEPVYSEDILSISARSGMQM